MQPLQKMYGSAVWPLTEYSNVQRDFHENLREVLTESVALEVGENQEDLYFNVLDPICRYGETTACIEESFKNINKEAKVRTYGLDNQREVVKRAKDSLYKARKAHFNEVRMSNGVFSTLFLMPPTGGTTAADVPYEIAVLDMTTLGDRYLANGGLLIYVVEKKAIERAAPILARRFENIKISPAVSADTQIHFLRHEMAIVTATKAKSKSIEEEKKMSAEIVEAMQNQGNIVENNSLFEKKEYVISPKKEVEIFKALVPDQIDLADYVEKESNVFKEFEKMCKPPAYKQAFEQRAMLPLSPMHQVKVVCAGLIDGCYGQGDNAHIVLADNQPRKTEEHHESRTVGGEMQDAYVYVTTREGDLKIFHKQGVFRL